MKTEITKSERKFSYLSHARTKWELIKCDIRRLAQVYSLNRARTKRDREKVLEKELAALEETWEKIGNNAVNETLTKYERTKNNLIDIANSKAKGAMLSSKVSWHEEGERSTIFFENKHISDWTRTSRWELNKRSKWDTERRCYMLSKSVCSKYLDKPKFNNNMKWKVFQIGQEMKLSDADTVS